MFATFPEAAAQPCRVDWIKLEENSSYRGELYLEMTYYATAPPPLQRRKTKMPTNERLVRSSQEYAYPGTRQAQSPPPGRGSRPSMSPPRPTVVPAHSTGGASSHLSPPTSTHVSPRTSPRPKYDALPPIPQDHLSPQSIPDILKPGNPRGDIHYSDKPHPRESSAHISPSHTPSPSAHGARSAVNVSLPQSPPRDPIAIPPHASPGAFSVPASLRAGLPPGHRRSTSGSPPRPARSMLSPQGQEYAHYPASPPKSPSPPLPPLPSSALSLPYGYPQPTVPQYASHHTPVPYAPISQMAQREYAPPARQQQPQYPAQPPMVPHVNHNTPIPYYPIPPAAQGEYPPPERQPQPQYHAQPPSVPYANYTTPVPYNAPLHVNQQGPLPSHTQAAPYYPPPRQPPPLTQYSVPPSSQGPPPLSTASERYSVPLALPDPPEGYHAPTPARHQPQMKPQAPVSTVTPPPVPTTAPVQSAPAEDPRKAALARSLEQEERDKRLALEIEREEETRRQEAEERDRADEELARKLDMELNLIGDEN